MQEKLSQGKVTEKLCVLQFKTLEQAQKHPSTG